MNLWLGWRGEDIACYDAAGNLVEVGNSRVAEAQARATAAEQRADDEAQARQQLEAELRRLRGETNNNQHSNPCSKLLPLLSSSAAPLPLCVKFFSSSCAWCYTHAVVCSTIFDALPSEHRLGVRRQTFPQVTRKVLFGILMEPPTENPRPAKRHTQLVASII